MAEVPAIVTPFYEDNPSYVAPPDSWRWPTGTAESQGMRSERLLQGAKQLAASPPARSFLILRNGVLVLEEYFNGSQASQSNNVHSVSKSLLSFLVGIAVRERVLHLDQPIADLLPSYFSISGPKRAITVRHLLTLTAGLKWTEDRTEYRIEKRDDRVQAILDRPLIHPPGEQFNYSSGLTHVLSAVIAEASGMGTALFAKKHLLDPLAITVEHWGRDAQGYDCGGYNLYLSARQLLKLGQLILEKGVWKGTSIVPPEWIASAVHPSARYDSTYSYGYLFWLLTLDGLPVIKMWGHGGQFVLVVPDRRLVVVLTADTKQEHPEWDAEAFLFRYVLESIY